MLHFRFDRFSLKAISLNFKASLLKGFSSGFLVGKTWNVVGSETFQHDALRFSTIWADLLPPPRDTVKWLIHWLVNSCYQPISVGYRWDEIFQSIDLRFHYTSCKTTVTINQIKYYTKPRLLKPRETSKTSYATPWWLNRAFIVLRINSNLIELCGDDAKFHVCIQLFLRRSVIQV